MDRSTSTSVGARGQRWWASEQTPESIAFLPGTHHASLHWVPHRSPCPGDCDHDGSMGVPWQRPSHQGAGGGARPGGRGDTVDTHPAPARLPRAASLSLHGHLGWGGMGGSCLHFPGTKEAGQQTRSTTCAGHRAPSKWRSWNLKPVPSDFAFFPPTILSQDQNL